MERTPHLPAPMTEMILGMEPQVEENHFQRGERMENRGFADPLGGTPVGAFSFGVGSQLPALPQYNFDHEPDDFSDLPPEIAELFEKIQQDEHFSCTPQRQLESGEIEDSTEFKSYRPTFDEIGTKFGPGKWRLKVQYRPKAWKKGDKTLNKHTPWVVLSQEAYGLRHREYLSDRESVYFAKLNQKREEKRAMYGTESQRDPMEMLASVASIAKMFAQPAPVNNGESMMPLMMKMMQDSADRSTQMMVQMTTQMANAQANAQAAAVQSQTQMMTVMMTMMQGMMQMGNESTNRVVGLLGNNSKESSLEMFREFRTFVTEGINASRNVNQLIHGEDRMSRHEEPEERDEGPSLVQTIMQAIPMVLANLSTLNAVPNLGGAREALINAKIKEEAGAPGAQAYKSLKEDSAFRVQMIVGFVRQYGREQAEEVLKAMLVPYTPQELAFGIKKGEELRAQDLELSETDTSEGDDLSEAVG